MRRTARALILALVLAVLLAGCHPATLTKVRGWPGATPVFASEEEALAAAEVAYGEYVRVADQIFMDGGAHPERLEAVATGSLLVTELAGFEEAAALGYHSTGGTVFGNLELQQYSPGSGTKGLLVAYVCEDVSAVDVLDLTGTSVVSPDRPDLTRFEVSFDLVTGASTRLLVAGKEPWGASC